MKNKKVVFRKLGPFLYILYISPMHHYFADDFQEYESFIHSPSAADQQRAYNNLSACLADQGKGLAANRLKLNEDKTDALLVSSKDRVKKQLISSIPLV